MQVNRPGALACAKLVGVGECIFQHLHHRDHAGRLVFNALDRRARFTQVREQKRHAAAAFGKLKRRVYRTANRLHIVFDAQQEAGDQLAALGLTAVEKRWRSGLEAPGEDLLHQPFSQRFIALGKGQRHHHDAIFKMLQVAFTVEGFQGVAGVILPRAEEGLETKTARMRALEKLHHEGAVVAGQHALLVIALFNQKVEAFLLAAKNDAVWTDVGGEKGLHRLMIFAKLNAPLPIIEVKHRV